MNGKVLAELDQTELERALAEEGDFLDQIGPLERVGFGFHSFVFRTASNWIVRVARSDEAARRHAREIELLPAIARIVPVAVPSPRVALRPRMHVPHGAVAYPALPGKLMAPADSGGARGELVAADLGAALAELHAAPHGPHDALGGLAVLPADHLHELRGDTSPLLRARLTSPEWAKVTAWWHKMLDGDFLVGARATVTHRDPWWENLTVDDEGLAGIIDWEFLSISDPASDLGVTTEMGEEFFQATLRSYRAASAVNDLTLETRARHLAEAQVFYGVRFAIQREDEGEWVDALAKLRGGRILAG